MEKKNSRQNNTTVSASKAASARYDEQIDWVQRHVGDAKFDKKQLMELFSTLHGDILVEQYKINMKKKLGL